MQYFLLYGEQHNECSYGFWDSHQQELSWKKTDFELGVGGGGQDTTQHFKGSFGSIRAILPI